MNKKIYSLVCNKSLSQVVVASELATCKAGGGSAGEGRSAVPRLAQLALAVLLAIAAPMALAGQTNCIGATAGGTNALGCGTGANALGANTTAIGLYAYAGGQGDSAFGYGSYANGGYSTAVGGWAKATGGRATAIGYGSYTAGFSNSVALGA